MLNSVPTSEVYDELQQALAWCMCGRPLERKGFCLIWLTERVRSCVRPSTRLDDRCPP